MSLRWTAAVGALLIVAAAMPLAHASTVTLARAGGGIVFTFTGGYASGPSAASILESHGMHATFYVSSGLLRQGTYYTAYMSATDVASLAARGHDVESMTVTHPDLTTLGSTQLASELADSQRALAAITGKSVRHLAYPYGAVNAAVASAASSLYLSGQTISWSIDDATSTVDAYHLPAFIMRSSTTLAEAKWIVDQAIARNVNVVLSFDGIVATPGPYDWTPSDLDALAAYVQAKHVPTSTVAQLVTGASPLAAPPPPPGAGTIVFGFDDGYTSQLSAAQTLVDHGMRGTFFIISDCQHAKIVRTCMSSSQIKTLSSQGQDIEPHTVTHPDLTTLSSDQLTHELRDSQATLRTLVGTPNLHTAYPFGAHNPTVRAEAAKYYKTARIYLTTPDVANLPTLLSQSGSDPMLVPGIGMGRATSLAMAEAYVDYAVAHGTRIELVFHDFLDKGGDSYTWDLASFNALVAYTAAKHVTVRTVAQAYG